MDEYCVQYVVSDWYDFVGHFRQLHSCMATSSAIIDSTCIFISFLLLVSELTLIFNYPKKMSLTNSNCVYVPLQNQINKTELKFLT